MIEAGSDQDYEDPENYSLVPAPKSKPVVPEAPLIVQVERPPINTNKS